MLTWQTSDRAAFLALARKHDAAIVVVRQNVPVPVTEGNRVRFVTALSLRYVLQFEEESRERCCVYQEEKPYDAGCFDAMGRVSDAGRFAGTLWAELEHAVPPFKVHLHHRTGSF